MDKAIEVRNLVKSYGQVVAVNKINFSINRGECFGIIGPNGAGKSSLLRMLYCTTLQDSGELYILGLNSRSSYSEIKGRIGVVPQDDGLDPDFTVLDNLLVYARFFGIPMAEAKSRAHRLLRILKLEEYEKYRCDQLSGGLRRRLSIARAMLNKPEVLFLDEPTTGLDPQARYFVWESIESLKKEKITILLTTHYMEEAEQSCDRIMIMDKGSIIGEGLPSQLIQNHVGSEIIEFDVLPADINYFVKKIQDEFEYQVLSKSVRLFIRPNQDSRQALNLVTSDNIIVRKAKLEDVFLKIAGYEMKEDL